MNRRDRAGKVYVDWSQNNPAKTTVTPYSLRGRDRPYVATPVSWEELAAPGLRQFEHAEVLDRVERHGDLMAER
jgi:bifunctional non-homologous end joining protein LigD